MRTWTSSVFFFWDVGVAVVQVQVCQGWVMCTAWKVPAHLLAYRPQREKLFRVGFAVKADGGW